MHTLEQRRAGTITNVYAGTVTTLEQSQIALEQSQSHTLEQRHAGTTTTLEQSQNALEQSQCRCSSVFVVVPVLAPL